MFTAWLWRQKPKAIEGQKGADFWHALLLYEGAFERGRGGWDYLCQGCVCAAACSGGHRPWAALYSSLGAAGLLLPT